MIPQFRLLCNISSLRLSSWHSSPVLTKSTSDTAHASLPRPHLQVSEVSSWATFLLVVAVRWVFSVCVCVCVCLHARTHAYMCACFLIYFVLWNSKAPHRHACDSVSYCVEISPPSWLPLQYASPSLNLLSLFLSFVSFLPPFEEIWLPFWVPGVLCQCWEVVLRKLLNIQMIFCWICWGESSLPILSVHDF